MRFMTDREFDGPGQVTFAPITAAVHQTADAPERVPQRNARREDIRQLPQRKFLDPGVEDYCQRGANQASIIDESAFPNFENVGKWPVCELVPPKGNHIQCARSQDRTENKPR